jgi:hypothetical protein
MQSSDGGGSKELSSTHGGFVAGSWCRRQLQEMLGVVLCIGPPAGAAHFAAYDCSEPGRITGVVLCIGPQAGAAHFAAYDCSEPGRISTKKMARDLYPLR